MQLKQIAVLFQFLLLNMLLVFGSVPSSSLAVETDSIAQDFPVTTLERSTNRASPAILADNVNYSEELMLELWRDGTVKSVWDLHDAGNGLLSFPTALPAPLNSSYPGIQDLRIDFLVSEVPQLSPEWGLTADFDWFSSDHNYPAFEDNYGDADYASFSSNEIRVTFRVWNETVNNSGVLYDGLNDSQELIKDILNDMSAVLGMTFHLMSNRTGSGQDFLNHYGLEQSWRAYQFNLNDTWNTLFSDLPLDEGLTSTTTSRLMQADARSLYLVAEWDENPDQENLPADPDEEDERWEFEAMLGILEREKVPLYSSNHVYMLKDLIDFETILYSHQKANESLIAVRLPYGSRINSLAPFDTRNTNGICYFELDLANNLNRRITEFDSVAFALDDPPLPSLVLQATPNVTLVSPGDVVQIDYNITNIGEGIAYNVLLIGYDNITGTAARNWDFINVTEGNLNFTFWNSGNGEATFNINQIDPGQSIIRSVFLNATTPSPTGTTFVETCDVTYDSVANPSAPSFVGWSATSMVNDGNDLRFWYNYSTAGASFDLRAMTPQGVVRIGETITLTANLTNTGNDTATNIIWIAPDFGFNQTNRDGTIQSLAANESIVISTTYIVDTATQVMDTFSREFYRARQLGRTESFDWYITLYTDPEIGPIGTNFDASEIRLDVLPDPTQAPGPFLTLDVAYNQTMYSPGELVDVSVTVKNIGDLTAENIAVTNEFSPFEFELVPGGGSVGGDLAAGDSFSFSYQLKSLTTAESFIHTYVSCDWTNGLRRTFHTRTFDWSVPTIDGPEDLEIIKPEPLTVSANETWANFTWPSLNWSLTDEHVGTYRLLRANASTAIPSNNTSAILAADLTFIEVASGSWISGTPMISFALSGLNDGYYLFTLEATDYSGNSANDSVAVTVRTTRTPLIVIGPEDIEIIRPEPVAISSDETWANETWPTLTWANLSWTLTDNRSGTYRILRANASSAIPSDNTSAILAADLTFVEVASGDWTSTNATITYPLSGLNDGYYLFTLEATDYSGHSANDTVAVVVRTLAIFPPTDHEGQEDEGFLEDLQNFLSENAPFLLLAGVLTVAVIAEGVVIFFMRK